MPQLAMRITVGQFIFCKWPWQFKDILAEYPVLIFAVTRLLLEQGGRNGSVRWNYLLVARELQTQHKRKLFFFIVGDRKCKMCNYFTFPPARQPSERENVYTVAIEQLDQYFTPQVNVPYERHIFRTMTQLPTKSVDQFITRLREKADCCVFGETADEHIRDQVIEKYLSSRLRRKLLERGRGLTSTIFKRLQEPWKPVTDRHTIRKPRTKKKGLNAIQGIQERRCFRCDNTGHMQDGEKCPPRATRYAIFLNVVRRRSRLKAPRRSALVN